MASVTKDAERYTKARTGELLSIGEAAQRLGLRPVTVRQWAAARKCARVKLGRRVLIPLSEIERLIEAATIPALPERTR
jgi:excisionase family DNA binding protein